MQHQPDIASLTAVLRERHRFQDWQGTNRLENELFHWRFFLTGEDLRGWRAESIRTITFPGWPPTVRSMWRGTGEVLISLQISECVSRSSAHDQLIEELANFQSTDMRRDERDGFGDIAFVLPARTVALFARANLVVLVANAGVEVVPVTDVAIAVDRRLTRRPSPGGTVVPEIQRLALYDGGPVTAGEPVGLDVQATDPLDRALRYEFWSRLGQVRVDDGTPVYLGHAVGTDELTVYAVNENGGVARATLPIEISSGQTR